MKIISILLYIWPLSHILSLISHSLLRTWPRMRYDAMRVSYLVWKAFLFFHSNHYFIFCVWHCVWHGCMTTIHLTKNRPKPTKKTEQMETASMSCVTFGSVHTYIGCSAINNIQCSKLHAAYSVRTNALTTQIYPMLFFLCTIFNQISLHAYWAQQTPLFHTSLY